MGLILLILIGILPGSFALNMALGAEPIQDVIATSRAADAVLARRMGGPAVKREEAIAELSAFLKAHGTMTPKTFAALAGLSADTQTLLGGKAALTEIETAKRGALRNDVYLLTETIGKLDRQGLLGSEEERNALLRYSSALEATIRYIPAWVKLAVAIALGLGTMIGWKRIVITIGEKIGKTHLSYAQGAAAELVAALTIAAADVGGWPVSTTHVLSSGVAGTMAANRSGLQMNTLRNLLLAWVLTLPVCVFLGAMLFALGLNVVAGLGLQ
jgi:PiT family inorganic phosphate transporter